MSFENSFLGLNFNNFNFNYNLPYFTQGWGSTNTIDFKDFLSFNPKNFFKQDLFNFTPKNYTFANFDTFDYSNSFIPIEIVPKKSSYQPISFKPINTDFSASNNKFTENPKFPEYNASLGKRLAQVAMRNANFVVNKNTKTLSQERKDPDKFTGLCATYVKMAIRDAGAGNYTAGNAYQLIDTLDRNPNFKKISASTSLKSLPAGCILVYDKGVEGYNKDYGHAEVITEDNRAVSDGITDNLYKKPSAIFMPV